MHDKRHDPGDRHLKREHGNGIARAQLALDGADGRHAGRVQQRKDQEHVNGENMVDSTAGDVAPKSTVRVEMTLSLAISPVTSAVEARQSPKPSGASSGAIMLPRPASRLCD